VLVVEICIDSSCVGCNHRISLVPVLPRSFSKIKTNKQTTTAATGISLNNGSLGILSYTGYIDMCGPKGYGFSAVLVINRVSIFCHFGLKLNIDSAL